MDDDIVVLETKQGSVQIFGTALVAERRVSEHHCYQHAESATEGGLVCLANGSVARSNGIIGSCFCFRLDFQVLEDCSQRRVETEALLESLEVVAETGTFSEARRATWNMT